MSDNDQRPPENPYGSQPPTNPYGQPAPPSPQQSSDANSAGREGGGSFAYPPPEGSPSSTPVPPPAYGQAPPYGQEAPYGQTSPYGQESSYGQAPQQSAYGSNPYGTAYGASGDARPSSVTAAGWTTIVLGVLGTLLYLGLALMLFLGKDFLAEAIRSDPGFEESGLSIDFIVNILGAVVIAFAIWSAINVLLGVLVLRRSNVARILLIISCAVLVLMSLASLAVGAFGSVISLLGAGAVIVLLFVGGASEWFARKGQAAHGGVDQGSPYGGSPYGR